MKVLILGSGGREHAIACAIARSERVTSLYCAPGNAGTLEVATNVRLDLDDLEGLVDFARGEGIDLTIVGPEAPLVAGIVDRFSAAGLRVFGPSAAGARLEGSKAWAKAFMQRHGIPTAAFSVATDLASARANLERMWREEGLVVKADGLAGGKGVVVAKTREEAEDALSAMLDRQELGAAGRQVVLEERLEGPEASAIAFLDGKTWHALPLARDHKALLEGDQGPNTGGMGVVAPVPVAAELHEQIAREVFGSLIQGLQQEGIDYRGVIFVGLMLTQHGPKVLEFNCRFGDPETQALLPGLETELLDVVEACLDGRLADQTVAFATGVRVCVVAAAQGYPGPVEKGQPITGLPEAEGIAGIRLFHAATRHTADGDLVTHGGRVLNVVATAQSLVEAQRLAYRAIDPIRFGQHMPVYRKDIGASLLEVAVR